MFVDGNNTWTLHPYGMSGLGAGFDSSGIFRTRISGSGIIPPPPIAPAAIPTQYATPSKQPGANFWNKGASRALDTGPKFGFGAPISFKPTASTPDRWGASALINEVNRVVNNASVGPVDHSVAQTSSLLARGSRLFGSKAIVSPGIIPPISPAVIQAAQAVAAMPTPAMNTTGTGPSPYTGGGGGGGGGGGEMLDQGAPQQLDAEVPPVGWWAGLSTVMKCGVVVGSLGAAYLGYKAMKRGGHSAGHKS
jgi:hypothetical protein